LLKLGSSGVLSHCWRYLSHVLSLVLSHVFSLILSHVLSLLAFSLSRWLSLVLLFLGFSRVLSREESLLCSLWSTAIFIAKRLHCLSRLAFSWLALSLFRFGIYVPFTDFNISFTTNWKKLVLNA